MLRPKALISSSAPGLVLAQGVTPSSSQGEGAKKLTLSENRNIQNWSVLSPAFCYQEEHFTMNVDGW